MGGRADGQAGVSKCGAPPAHPVLDRGVTHGGAAVLHAHARPWPPTPSTGLVRHWAKANTTAARKHEAALRLLQALGLLQREARGGATSWALHPTFQAQLRAALADK